MKQKTKIRIEGLEVLASIGVHPHEHERTQPVIIDISVNLGGHRPPAHDRLEETLDYALVADKAAELAQSAHVQLVETLAYRIAHWVLSADSRVKSCKVRIRKPHALINAESAGVVYRLKRQGNKS